MKPLVPGRPFWISVMYLFGHDYRLLEMKGNLIVNDQIDPGQVFCRGFTGNIFSEVATTVKSICTL